MSLGLRWGSQVLGWVDRREELDRAMRIGLDYLIVEGVMELLTGNSRDTAEGVSSTMGFIKKSNSDVILVASASYDGVEGTVFKLKAYVDILMRTRKKPVAVILNNVYHGANEDEELSKFKAELYEKNIPLFLADSLALISKPEELIDLGDYEEAAIKISELMCKSLINVLSRG